MVQWHSDWKYAQPTISVYMPAAPAIGDVLVVALWNNGQSGGSVNTYTAPAGWTLIDQNVANSYATYQAYSHVVTAGDMNNYVFTPLAADRETVWMAADVTNASALAPVDTSADVYVNGTSFTTPAVTPAHAGDLAIAFNMPIPTSAVTWTDPSDWTLGMGPTLTWSAEALYQAQSGTTPVSESSTLSAAATGFSAITLVSPSGP